MRYGGLTGVVSQVAPDASTDKSGAPYFEVIVETDKAYLGEKAGKLPITPGMQARTSTPAADGDGVSDQASP